MALATERAYEYESFGYEANVQIPPTDVFSLDYGTPQTVIAASDTTPIRIQTSAPHGYTTGDIVDISGVTGNTAANGRRTVTVFDADEFDLAGTVGNGVYAGGGTAQQKIETCAASIVGIMRITSEFLPWNVCSTPGLPRFIVAARHRVRSF